jgi:type IV fimbrial biogenesis protein FimT
MLSPSKGLTLLELLIAIAVFAIIAVLGVPSFYNYLDYQRTQAVFNDLKSNLQTAAIETKTRHKFVYVCPSADAATCSGTDWRSRYIVCVDSNSDQTCDVVLKTANASSLQSMTVDVSAALVAGALRFHPGGENNTTSFSLCSKFHENSEKFAINSFGSISASVLTAAECPSS